MKIKSLILSFVFCSIFCGDAALAQEGNYYAALADKYSWALSTRKDAVIFPVWDAINADSKAQVYLEATRPRLYAAFKLQGMAIKLEGHLEEYRRKYGAIPGYNPFISYQMDERVEALVSNQDEALSNPNQDQLSMQQVHFNTMNSPLISNTAQAQITPNQNTRSNQDSIKSQLERMGL